MNIVILTGRLGRDPEIRETKSGTAVTTIRLATDQYRGKDDDGNAIREAEWHNVVVWGGTATFLGDYAKKGSQIAVRGELQTRSYESDGVTKYVTEVKAHEVDLLSGPSAASSNGDGATAEAAPAAAGEDDFPF